MSIFTWMINVLLIFAVHKFCVSIVNCCEICHTLWKIILRRLLQSTTMKVIVESIKNIRTIVLCWQSLILNGHIKSGWKTTMKFKRYKCR